MFSVRASSTLLRAAPTRALRVSNVSTRAYSAAPKMQLKEDKIRTPEEAEAAKQNQLRKQKEGKGHWHEELASSSEASVKADQDASQIGNHAEHQEELQRLGKEKAEKGEIAK